MKNEIKDTSSLRAVKEFVVPEIMKVFRSVHEWNSDVREEESLRSFQKTNVIIVPWIAVLQLILSVDSSPEQESRADSKEKVVKTGGER